MRIATWNVNSLRARAEHLLKWLDGCGCDAVLLQETKVPDEDFPHEPFTEAGWQVLSCGQKSYNGVAILSRAPLADPLRELPGIEDDQRRLLAASLGDMRLIDVYVPNGSEVGSDKYAYKLRWLDALIDYVADELRRHPRLVLAGDFNIAPSPQDTHDPEYWDGRILCSQPERERFRRLLDLGLVDCMARFPRTGRERFTWWDYRALGWQMNKGLRIDHVLASPALAASLVDCRVDTTPRRWKRPSDHAPVIAEFSDDGIGEM